MTLGWTVLGDGQRLNGYSLLLHDLIVDNIYELDFADRNQILQDMKIIGILIE